MKRFIFVLISFYLLFALFSFSVSSEISIPSGYDIQLYPDVSYNLESTFSLKSSPSSESLFYVATRGGVPLLDVLNQVYEGLPILGYLDYTVRSGTGIQEFTFSLPPSFSSYSQLYVVTPFYYINNRSNNPQTGILSYTFPFDSLSGPSYSISWAEVYPGGPSAVFYYAVNVVSLSELKARVTITDYQSNFNDFSGGIDMPLYMPVFFTTKSSALDFVNERLESIENLLSSVEDGISGTNSRIDEIESGLFNSPSGWDDYNQSVQHGIDQQASLENSVDQEAMSNILAGFENVSFDPGGVAGDIQDALGNDPGGSSFVKFFQWLWTVNPMLPLEIGIIVSFFVVGLVIRTYA